MIVALCHIHQFGQGCRAGTLTVLCIVIGVGAAFLLHAFGESPETALCRSVGAEQVIELALQVSAQLSLNRCLPCCALRTRHYAYLH
jgi:predicted Kef-type K+ transport protein